MARISQRDVELLAADPNPANRQATMLRVGELYGSEPLSAAERQIALQIIQTILPEAELEIRRRLSETLKSTPHLDRHLARRLAEDVLDVATPILVQSLALTDEDLVQVIQSCSIDHSRAVAMRPTLNVSVTDALINTDDEIVVLRVAANNNARISAGGFHHVLDRFGDHARIAEAVGNRPALPLAIVDTLLQHLYRERFIEIRETITPQNRRYSMLDRGWERVRRLLDLNAYIGAAPVSLNAYTAMVNNQEQHRPPVTHDAVRAALANLVLPDTALQMLGVVQGVAGVGVATQQDLRPPFTDPREGLKVPARLALQLDPPVARRQFRRHLLQELLDGVLDAQRDAARDFAPRAAQQLPQRHALLLRFRVPESILHGALGHAMPAHRRHKARRLAPR